MAYKISILGTGNVAWHLAKTLDAAGHSIAQVYGRTLKNAQNLANLYGAHAIDNLQQFNYDVDVLLLCVADDAIATIANQLTRSKCLVAHTSGAVDMEVLKNTSEYYGVFYPLQTLSEGKPVNFFEVPVCIEGSNKAAEMQLKALADTISNRVHFINSEKRRYLHLAAVFANNFSNAMYASAAKIVEGQGIDFNMLRPLIKETAEKVQTLSPKQAQTGPAKRHDTITQQKHLELLAPGSDEEKIYRLLTDMIAKQYNN
jgi:predicted short-subunit dehydrogenase-like oxidoreductase (DUF2520 family)